MTSCVAFTGRLETSVRPLALGRAEARAEEALEELRTATQRAADTLTSTYLQSVPTEPAAQLEAVEQAADAASNAFAGPMPDGGLEHGEVFACCFDRMRCGRGCPAGLRPALAGPVARNRTAIARSRMCLTCLIRNR
jgi:hypothetical protein